VNAETDSFTTIFEHTFAIFLISKINTQVTGFQTQDLTLHPIIVGRGGVI